MDTLQTLSKEVVQAVPWLFTRPGLMLIAFVGMFCHFLVKNVKGETLTDITSYFKDHLRSTLVALIVTWISVLGYWYGFATNQAADVIVVFLLGFGFDSTLNKWTQQVDTKPLIDVVKP